MTKALELLQTHPSVEFKAAVARAAGMMACEARSAPDKTYTTVEIAELFDYLYDLMQHRYREEKEPAGGHRTGSDT